MSLIEKVAQNAEAYRDKNILVGLSGGADSVCLAHSLKTLGFNVYAAHINHNIRGDEAERDEMFVRSFCENEGIKLFVQSIDVPCLAKLHGRSLEDEGRCVRYSFFEGVELSDKIIATAHNKNDNAETVLMHLIRGSGGLKGIPKRQGVIRPLLDVTRTEIEEYCKIHGLSYCIDSTNLSDDYTRNRIRHNVLPELEKINPDVLSAILRGAEISSAEGEFVKSQADKIPLEFQDGRVFANCGQIEFCVLLKLIRRMYEKIYGSDKNLSYASVKSAAELVKSGKTGKRADLYEDIFLETEYGGFSVGRDWKNIFFCKKIDGRTEIPQLNMWISKKISKYPMEGILLDGEKTGEIYVRSRKNGDVASVNGHRKKLKDILIDKKIPKRQRCRVAVLESDGCVLGTIDFGINKEYKPNENTKEYIILNWGII